MKSCIDAMVMKVELLADLKEYCKGYVLVHDTQDWWTPTSLNRRRIHKKPISKPDTNNMQIFIVHDDPALLP
jgi:hypothetical protein